MVAMIYLAGRITILLCNTLRILVLLTIPFFSSACARGEREISVVDNVISGFIRPTFDAFAVASGQFVDDMSNLCDRPGTNTLEKARDSYRALVTTWSRAEIVRLGPLLLDNRYERVLFWPDRRGRALKQIQSALISQDHSLADPLQLKGKSVALQGLGAAEYILFASYREKTPQPGEFSCLFGRAIALNVASIADEVVREWQPGAEFPTLWSRPSEGNPIYRNDGEALTEFFDMFLNGLELTRDARLRSFLVTDQAQNNLKNAIYWRSGQTIISITESFRSLHDFFKISKIGLLLKKEDHYIEEFINVGFIRIADQLAGLDLPVADIIVDVDGRRRLDDVIVASSGLSSIASRQLSAALGLTAGFSSLDGD